MNNFDFNIESEMKTIKNEYALSSPVESKENNIIKELILSILTITSIILYFAAKGWLFAIYSWFSLKSFLFLFVVLFWAWFILWMFKSLRWLVIFVLGFVLSLIYWVVNQEFNSMASQSYIFLSIIIACLSLAYVNYYGDWDYIREEFDRIIKEYTQLFSISKVKIKNYIWKIIIERTKKTWESSPMDVFKTKESEISQTISYLPKEKIEDGFVEDISEEIDFEENEFENKLEDNLEEKDLIEEDDTNEWESLKEFFEKRWYEYERLKTILERYENRYDEEQKNFTFLPN